ncbi:hypothetical protein ACBJ59_14230 [Nonomuraea sp. MTCD27]|uniref:hypothetical protein n=1 Tax=Nonomuraea sp. MTCD27 TaxID=1676747 RepID=UPI0035C0218E
MRSIIRLVLAACVALPVFGSSPAAAFTAADSWHRDSIPYTLHAGYVNGVWRNVARLGEGELYWTDYGARVTVSFWLKDFATDGYCAAGWVDEFGYEPVQTHTRLECNGVDKWVSVSLPSTGQRICQITVRVGRQKSSGALPPESAGPWWTTVGSWNNRDGC